MKRCKTQFHNAVWFVRENPVKLKLICEGTICILQSGFHVSALLKRAGIQPSF